MAEAQDVETLKRRGRRRLVGAIALVLAAVVVLPMVFDPQPRRDPPPVSVRIPGENEAGFVAKPAAKAAPRAPAPRPKPAAEYIVQVGVFANPANVIGQLSAAKLPHYTEPMNGRLTRVRAGPFATRAEAEKAHEKLKSLGLEPGAVSQKSG